MFVKLHEITDMGEVGEEIWINLDQVVTIKGTPSGHACLQTTMSWTTPKISNKLHVFESPSDISDMVAGREVIEEEREELHTLGFEEAVAIYGDENPWEYLKSHPKGFA